MRVRSSALLVSLVLTFGFALAGCIGGGDDLESNPADDAQPMAGLQTQIRLGEPADTWFEPGTVLDVEAVEPPEFVGNLTYTWAIQPNRWTDWFNEPYYNTSNVAPGEQAQITFNEPGFHDMGHCHYHPTQTQTVAVLEGYDSPDEVIVFMLEGNVADQSTYSFAPEHITIAPGTTVTYVNAGQVDHTMSIHDWPTPEPVVLDLTERTGQITLDRFVGDSVDLFVFVEDEAGNGGFAEQTIYVREKLESTTDKVAGNFSVAHELLNEELAGLGVENRIITETFTYEWSGRVTLNVSLEGPQGTLNSLDIGFYQLDDNGDRVRTLISENATGTNEFSVDIETVIKREYELMIQPAQGLLIDFVVEVIYEPDHTPPVIDVGTPCPEPHYSLGHC